LSKVAKSKKTKTEKEDVKKMTPDEFDSVMKQILSAPKQVKKKTKKVQR
jgi:hypothetical protein